MSFAPLLPLGGYAGWAFLNRTMERQQAAFETSGTLKNDEAHFRERIGEISSAEELVADRRLLRIALGAFGLEGDIDNRFFIRKVLEDGALDPKALSNRLADKRYQQFSAVFGFGDVSPPHSVLSDFPEKILSAYRTRSFEAAVGRQDENMRLALNARRELAEIAGRDTGADARWFTVMGSPPLRKVFETAFGLPAAFGALDIDRQLVTLRDKATAIFGEGGVEQFADADRAEELIRRFLLRADMAATLAPVGGASTALMLLQSAAGMAR